MLPKDGNDDFDDVTILFMLLMDGDGYDDGWSTVVMMMTTMITMIR